MDQQSTGNRRIFVGGIPDYKKKDEIWQELERSGMCGITDVIMYRSYTDKNRNRGFVFVEFETHQEAAWARRNFRNLILFEQRVQIDWSTPMQNIEPDVMKRVKKLFFRNLNVCQERHEFAAMIVNLLGSRTVVEKIYKHRDYAFVHFKTRRDAERGLNILNKFFSKTDVEITWATPPPPKPEMLSPHCYSSESIDILSTQMSNPTGLPSRICDSNSVISDSSLPEKRDYVTLMDLINYITTLDA